VLLFLNVFLFLKKTIFVQIFENLYEFPGTVYSQKLPE